MSDAMVWLLSGVIGVLSSLVASGMFLLALSRLRPKLVISPVISKAKDDKGNPTYFVKVINRTRNPVIGVRARMRIAIPQNVPGGTIYYMYPVKLRSPELMELPRFDYDDQEANYAVRFTVAENLDVRWSEDDTSRVHFEIYGTHALTGFGKAFEKVYYQKRTDLVEKEFKFGNSLETV